MPVAEAMACGTPVVVSDRGSLPEVVADAGIVVEPTAQAVEDGLASILTDPGRAAHLAERGPVVAARYRWDTMASQVVRALQQAV
jgi:glycosyltransferase involved in cell wall biosynthesis